MDQNSDFLPNKCGRRVDGGVDRISQLPDEILVVILSFLSLRRAVTTSVLSSRWSELWKHIPYLNLDKFILSPHYHFQEDEEHNFSFEAKRCKYLVSVNSIIRSHKAVSLKKFRISLPVKKSDRFAVTKWLKFVLSRQVESLELDFELKYKGWDVVVLQELLREERLICRAPETLIFFQSLKRLCLKCMMVSGEDIELFVWNCPLLEQLTIDRVTLTSDIKVCGEKLILKRLHIVDCRGEKSIKVSAPNLRQIRFSDSAGTLLFENVPKLVEAGFILVGSLPSAASCYISQLQSLQLCVMKAKVFWMSGFPKMPNLKKLKFYNNEMYKHSLLPLTSLIWASPRLEEFKLQYFGKLKDASAWMGAITNVERSPHQHLKVFKFHMASQQYVGVGDHMVELVTYVLNNCVALQHVIIGCPFWEERVSGTQITAAMKADAADFTRQIQAKVPNHIQLELTYAN